MSKFKSLRPILWTEHLKETVHFYTQILGFKIGEQNNDWQWASLCKDDVEIMLAKPNEHEQYEKIGFSGSFYFSVENVDELWENMKEKCKICYPLETFEWEMKEFAVYDNNGYILQFGQDVENSAKEE